MSAKHHMTAIPNSAIFNQIFEKYDKKVIKMAKDLEVSAVTITKLLSGKKVRAGIIKEIADRINKPYGELVEHDQARVIPYDKKLFSKLAYGWFTDNDRKRGEKAKWFSELVRLKPVKTPPDDNSLLFTGEIKNFFGSTYIVKGEFIARGLFFLTARTKDGSCGFSATFTHYFESEHILCGTWTGLTFYDKPCVYRFFISKDKLDIETLTRIAGSLHVDTVFNAETF